ncbi:hypothetical protein CcaverHIS631_0302520 [Cutaneotrichosporon cavernicola]|nr:hypothetical protein CcaverHIS631_0302520 [Cutaneotrichosporon cavernicola]
MDFDVVPYEDIVWGERIGGGSFGSVFKGQYLGLDIAIKEIHASTEYNVHKYFEREWRIMRECRHPNIVLFLGLSRAVAYLHARQCIHRDLKGENLLIASNNRIKVGDFGFARITSRNEEEMKNLTYCGTDGYMSPEIVMGESFDLPTDVYSLGIIFIEILTRIVVGSKVYSRQAPVLTPDPDAVRGRASAGCPPDFVDLALQCCSFAPADRPTLPEILLRLRQIETNVGCESEVDCTWSTKPFRREGKRAMPIFDYSSDDEAEALIDDQLMPREDSEEKTVYQALTEVNIVIDGSGPSLDLIPSSALADASTGVFYNTASEMMSYDNLTFEGDSNARPSSFAMPGPIPCTYPEEEASSTRTVKGVLENARSEASSPDSPREASLRLDVPEEALDMATLPTPRPSVDGHSSAHRFMPLLRAAEVLNAKRIPSSFAASLARVLLPRTLARLRERCMLAAAL